MCNDDAETADPMWINDEVIGQTENTSSTSPPIIPLQILNPLHFNVGTQCCFTARPLVDAQTETDETSLNQSNTIQSTPPINRQAPPISTHLLDHNYYANHQN